HERPDVVADLQRVGRGLHSRVEARSGHPTSLGSRRRRSVPGACPRRPTGVASNQWSDQWSEPRTEDRGDGMRILIVGAGIAGPTLAYWLHRAGHEPVIVEHAPALRDGGYLVDFWGSGFDVADRMGIVPRLVERGYVMREVREVSDSGRRIAHFDPRPVIGTAGGRYVSIARADLAGAICDALDDEVEMIFGDTVRSLRDDGTKVQVEFEHR